MWPGRRPGGCTRDRGKRGDAPDQGRAAFGGERVFNKDDRRGRKERLAAWRLSYVPAPVLRALRNGKQALMYLRHHPLLLAPDARRALDVITPLLAAE